MTARRRARSDQYARRINAAAALLAGGLNVPEAARRLARRYRVSERQARRYVELARDEGEVEVPGAKIVFTVKLPREVARRVREQARRSGQTISALVTQALQEFLDQLRAGSGGGR
jgi:DNA-binding transcriptional regulator LsrR (DeoR family)